MDDKDILARVAANFGRMIASEILRAMADEDMDFADIDAALGWNGDAAVLVESLVTPRAEKRPVSMREVAEIAWALHRRAYFDVEPHVEALSDIETDPGTCDHEWLDTRNQAIDSGEMCVFCGLWRDNIATWDGQPPLSERAKAALRKAGHKLKGD